MVRRLQTNCVLAALPTLPAGRYLNHRQVVAGAGARNASGLLATVEACDGDRIFHTYSAYGRGVDQLLGTYNYLDLTPLGRQRHVSEFQYHDKYNTGDAGS